MARCPDPKDRPKPPVIVKRERKRQQRLAERKGGSAPAPLPDPQTLLGMVRGVSTWSECSVPLTAVVNREMDPHGKIRDWLWVDPSSCRSGEQTRATYALRPALEERHRQYKCFWDIFRMHSREISLVVNQVLFVLLAYTLRQVPLFLCRREELNRVTRTRSLALLGPTVEGIAVYYQQRFCLLSLPEFAAILLQVAEPARAKLLEKMRQLKRDLYQLLQNPRPRSAAVRRTPPRSLRKSLRQPTPLARGPREPYSLQGHFRIEVLPSLTSAALSLFPHLNPTRPTSQPSPLSESQGKHHGKFVLSLNWRRRMSLLSSADNQRPSERRA